MSHVILNSNEKADYNCILAQIPALQPGIYYFRDFFPGRSASPRVGRRLCEEVVSGNLPRLRLAGKLAKEGYAVI